MYLSRAEVDDEQTPRAAPRRAFARDVQRELRREQEDGTTPVHTLFDDAVTAAVEDGCESADYDDDPPSDRDPVSERLARLQANVTGKSDESAEPDASKIGK